VTGVVIMICALLLLAPERSHDILTRRRMDA
jgi:hypothetical protein